MTLGGYWIGILVLPVTNSVIFVKLLNIHLPQFPHLQNGENNSVWNLKKYSKLVNRTKKNLAHIPVGRMEKGNTGVREWEVQAARCTDVLYNMRNTANIL